MPLAGGEPAALAVPAQRFRVLLRLKLKIHFKFAFQMNMKCQFTDSLYIVLISASSRARPMCIRFDSLLRDSLATWHRRAGT